MFCFSNYGGSGWRVIIIMSSHLNFCRRGDSNQILHELSWGPNLSYVCKSGYITQAKETFNTHICDDNPILDPKTLGERWNCYEWHCCKKCSNASCVVRWDPIPCISQLLFPTFFSIGSGRVHIGSPRTLALALAQPGQLWSIWPDISLEWCDVRISKRTHFLSQNNFISLYRLKKIEKRNILKYYV